MSRISIKNAQKIVNDLVNRKNWKTDSLEIFNHLVEEIGEVARELRKENIDKNLEKELADVLFLLFKLANHFKIDLEDVFLDKFKEIEKRF
jgi:NTP pyrophosphatase (non-canonical NTP hydrolase)